LLIRVYSKVQPEVTIELEHLGTATGLTALLAGECDLAAASRPATEDKERLARSRGVEVDYYIIGYYGATVIVNTANRLRDLTDRQVRDVFTGTIANWKALGGHDAPIHL